MASLKDKTMAPAQEQSLVYVGPNMGGELPMQQFTVFRGGLTDAVKTRCEQDLEFAALFVPVSGLSQARQALERTGSELHRAYGSVWTAYSAKRTEGK